MRAGWKLENKLKNEVKIQKFSHKMSITIKPNFSETGKTYIYI